MDSQDARTQALTTAALLSGQLDGLMAAWERTIAAEQAAAHIRKHGPRHGDPGGIVAELERDLSRLEAEATTMRGQADAEMARAFDWEQRMMIAVKEGRHDLAKEAIRRIAEHRDAAEALGVEATATQQAADAYRNAVTAMRAESTPEMQQSTPSDRS